MKDLSLVLLTPFGKVFEGEAKAIYAPSINGPLGILREHTPLIAELAPKGVLKVETSEKNLYFALFHGAVEVMPDRVIILSEEALIAFDEEEAIALSKKERKTVSFLDPKQELGEKVIKS